MTQAEIGKTKTDNKGAALENTSKDTVGMELLIIGNEIELPPEGTIATAENGIAAALHDMPPRIQFPGSINLMWFNFFGRVPFLRYINQYGSPKEGVSALPTSFPGRSAA